jgi:hypothetical protein
MLVASGFADLRITIRKIRVVAKNRPSSNKFTEAPHSFLAESRTAGCSHLPTAPFPPSPQPLFRLESSCPSDLGEPFLKGQTAQLVERQVDE